MDHRTSILIATFLVSVSSAAQQPGDLDSNFHYDGKLILADHAVANPGNVEVITATDLGLLVAYEEVDSVRVTHLVRLNEDGSVDTAFGDNGWYHTSGLHLFKALKRQSDGKVVLVGRRHGFGVPGELEMIIERLLPDGTPDVTYGYEGKVVLPYTQESPGQSDLGRALMLPDDRLIVHGRTWMCRLNADGTLDQTFANEGFLEGLTNVQEVVMLPDGRLLWIAFGVWGTPCLVDHDGSAAPINVGMSSAYTPTTPLQGRLAMNKFGVVAGHVSVTISPPPTGGYGGSQGFGRVGNLYMQSGTMVGVMHYSPAFGSSAYGQSFTYGVRGPVCADQEGNFYCAYLKTSSSGPITSEWLVRRMLPTGHGYDPSFGTSNATSYTAFDPDNGAVPVSALVQDDGKLVVAGRCTIDGLDRLVMARYHAISDPRAKLSLKMILGGGFDQVEGRMRTDLINQDLLPNVQPYTAPHYHAAGGVGSWSAPLTAMHAVGEEAVVDWVWLELLDPSYPTNIVATQAALLHRNGIVTTGDGVSPVDFAVGPGPFLLRVRHRNHLSVTLAEPVELGATPTFIDLTDPATATFGTDAQMEVNGVRMLWPGDVTGDGLVRYTGFWNDRDPILEAIGGTNVTAVANGYHNADLNMDGQVKYTGAGNDRDLILQTIGGSVPTDDRLEQIP